MKKLILLLMFVLFTGCQAETKEERQSIREAYSNYKITEHCVDGYVYYVYHSGYAGGMTQAFVFNEHGFVVPKICKEKK